MRVGGRGAVKKSVSHESTGAHNPSFDSPRAVQTSGCWPRERHRQSASAHAVGAKMGPKSGRVLGRCACVPALVARIPDPPAPKKQSRPHFGASTSSSLGKGRQKGKAETANRARKWPRRAPEIGQPTFKTSIPVQFRIPSSVASRCGASDIKEIPCATPLSILYFSRFSSSAEKRNFEESEVSFARFDSHGPSRNEKVEKPAERTYAAHFV